ncbi:hypothetical protein [Arthrobacter humicola]|uniref:hypothetical protein n=1 Tax=Arthrobacter humicola TaxID=409291 RepID=UPI0031D24EDC
MRSLGKWVPVSLLVIWVALLPRIIPGTSSDRGIFVSVAERLLAGDTLYRDVWDNKDPLFYYSLALGRTISPYADILLELTWIVSAGTAVYVLARKLGCNAPGALFAAFGMTPLILTGGLYRPGYTHLPGTALVLLVLAATVSRRFAAAGFLLAILACLKLVMLPIALLLILTVITLRKEWRALVPGSAAFALCAAALAGLLYARGELFPYLQAQLANVSYSQGDLVDERWGSFVGHLMLVASIDAVVVATAVAGAIVWVFAENRLAGGTRPVERRSLMLWACAATALVAALVVLGFTGMWDHHGQVLYVPAILVGVGAVQRFQSGFNVRSKLHMAALVGLIVALSGPTAPLRYGGAALISGPRSLAALNDVSAEARAVLSVGPSGTYARLGANDDDGHAYGLRDWKLACPRFQQYAFDTAEVLNSVAECLPRAEVILLSPAAGPKDGDPTWNAYWAKVESTLRDGYACEKWQDERICTRRDGK